MLWLLLRLHIDSPGREFDLGQGGETTGAANDGIRLLSLRVGDALEASSVVNDVAGADDATGSDDAATAAVGRVERNDATDTAGSGSGVGGKIQLSLRRRRRRRNDVAITRPVHA